MKAYQSAVRWYSKCNFNKVKMEAVLCWPCTAATTPTNSTTTFKCLSHVQDTLCLKIN